MDPPFFRVNITLASLSLSQFDATYSVNANAVGVLPRSELALWASGSVTNAAALAALATQVAKDWYLYQIGKLDIVFAGLAPWTPEGTSDYVEWTQTNDMVSTRVQRGQGGGGYAGFPTARPLGLKDGSGNTIIENIYYLSLPDGSYTIVNGVLTITGGLEHDINAWKQGSNWYTSNNTGGLNPIFSLNSGYLYGIPVIVTRNRTVNKLGCYIESGNAGANLKLALYDITSDSSILPNTALAVTGNIDASANNTMVSADVSVPVVPGHYWLLAQTDLSLGIFGVMAIVPTLPVTDDPPTQKVWLKNNTSTIGDPVPFALGDAVTGDGPYIAWRM